MQAMLSSTASGKQFRTSAITAPLPAAPCTIFSALAVSTVGMDDDSYRGLEEPQSLSQHESSHRSALPCRASVAEGVGLAHDAGNLLGALGLYCELLALPGVLRNEHRHYAEELQLLSARSRQLIDRLLNPETTGRTAGQPVSAAGSGRMIGEAQPAHRTEDHDQSRQSELVIVPDVIEQCRGMLGAVARRAVEVAYGADAALPVAVSREALERILVNLTKNAAEASETAGAGTITLRVTCLRARAAGGAGADLHDRIVLSVEDKGCGMSTAAVKVLLGDGGPIPTGPHGIGFQVVRELVGASGGELRLRSRSGDEGPVAKAAGGGSGTAGDLGSPGNPGATGTTVEITWAVAAEACAPVEKLLAAASITRSAKERRQSTPSGRNGSARRVSC